MIYIGPVFTDFFCTEHRASLETSSPPATSVHQDDTLTYAVFVLETELFFATGLCQPGSLVYFSISYSLISHHSYVFLVYSAVSETKSSLKEYIVYATRQQN